MEENKVVSYYSENIKFNRKALTEVYEILMEYEDGIENIPENIMRVIEDNIDMQYEFDIDEIENIELMEDTKKILTYLYTEFLSTGEEHEVLKQMEKMQYEKRMQIEANENAADVDEIFFSKQIEEEVEKIELPVEYKESVLKKIINKILGKLKNIFN